MSFDYSRTASAPPGAPGTAACGVGYHATMIGSGGTQLVYPANTPAASVGRYGTGNQIVDYQWGAFDAITEDALNEGRCRSVLGNGMGPPNPACQQNFGSAEDAPVPPSAPAPPTDSASTSPSPPTGATACVGHYDDCPENCVDVTYHYDVQAHRVIGPRSWRAMMKTATHCIRARRRSAIMATVTAAPLTAYCKWHPRRSYRNVC